MLDCACDWALENHLMTGVVLIGGRSRRFGSDKVLSGFKGKPLIKHVIETISPLFDETILIGHRRKGLDEYRVVEDIRPGCGPLGGIYTALNAATSDYCFVCAADMLRLNREFISHMITLADAHDIIMPMWSKGREPLHAIYRKTVIPYAAALLEQEDFKIYSLIQKVDTLIIPEETIRAYGDPEVLFSNVNTMGDLLQINT
jgi:molybdopterin-guanine dinucleotide biosynthesis protein A